MSEKDTKRAWVSLSIQLRADQSEALRELAKREYTPQAVLIRQAIDMLLREKSQ